MKTTLKSQVLLLLTTLVCIILVQSFFTYKTQQQSTAGINQLRDATITLEIVRNLERDVLHLQRNLLLYKATGSDSVADRFQYLSDDVHKNLIRLEHLANTHQLLPESYFELLRTHLNDYGEDFDEVVRSRTEQSRLFNNLLPLLDELLQNDLDGQSRYHLMTAKNIVFQYMSEPDGKHLPALKSELVKAALPTGDNPEFSQTIDKLSRDFTQLTQTTRGYIFLVNVVMAGSANEILYLTNKMIEVANEQRLLLREQVASAEDFARTRNTAITLVCIVLVLLLASMINKNIISPITRITRVFGEIISGKNIKAIPGIDRQDEIGQLSQAAGVFYEHSQMQRRLNQELQIATKRAEDSTKSKSLFLANMSHEIRTPINGILGLIQLCQKTELTQVQQDYLAKAAHSSEVLVGVINDILDFSKIEAGKLELEQVNFNLDELLERILSSMLVGASERGLNLRLFVEPGVETFYAGDPLRISQVLLNLLNNAVKFTEAGSVTIIVRLQSRQAENTDLEFQVIDTGIGMSKQQLKSVFAAFSQADDSTSRKFGGTGLGLSIVNQLVNLMEGEITVKSIPEVGSEFTVRLNLGNVEQTQHELTNTHATNLILAKSDLSQSLISFLPEAMKFTEISSINERPSLSFPKQRLIIGIDNIDQALEMNEQIYQMSSEGHFPGFVIDMSPPGLRQQLLDNFNLPVLEHPVSKQQLLEFFNQLSEEGPRQLDDDICYLGSEAVKLKGHVLLVEDNGINQAVAMDMLEEFGLTCEVADNGLQAVKRIEAGESYDLVLMDVQMPIMDGYQATREIRKQGFDQLKICGLSANAMKSDINLAMEHGMDDYLTKPIDWDSLEKTLLKYLPRQNAVTLH